MRTAKTRWPLRFIAVNLIEQKRREGFGVVDPEQVRVHDFVIPELGRVTPYGVYDVGKNRGWVSVGIEHDTATFAVESIRRWWRSMGKPVYRQAQRLLITADSGGSNGSRVRLWKLELQHCLHVTLRARLRPLAAGLSPRAVLDKFAAIQMLDVHFPTTDGRTLILSRYTHPEPDHKILLQQLKLTLPAQPPPRISSRGKLLNQN